MTDSTHSTILRRMAGRKTGNGAEAPLTSSRAVRLAMTKSANDTVGLVLTVMGMSEEVVALDDLLAALDENLMLIGLLRDDALAGIVAVDMQFRAAILEMQTVGQLIAAPAEERKATGTDRMMCEPVLNALLQALPNATVGTEFDGWVDGAELGSLIDSSRAAGLILKDHEYRILRLEVDLAVADRKGLLMLALPLNAAVDDPVVEVVADQDWDTQFQSVIADAPACLDTLLHRMKLPLVQARNLEVGQILPLPGCTVNSVRLLSPDGQLVAQAKLGQLGGKRAVRIESEPIPQMMELGGAAASGLPDMMVTGLADDAAFAVDAPMNLGEDGLELGAGLEEDVPVETAMSDLDELPDMSPQEGELPDLGDLPMMEEPLSLTD